MNEPYSVSLAKLRERVGRAPEVPIEDVVRSMSVGRSSGRRRASIPETEHDPRLNRDESRLSRRVRRIRSQVGSGTSRPVPASLHFCIRY